MEELNGKGIKFCLNSTSPPDSLAASERHAHLVLLLWVAVHFGYCYLCSHNFPDSSVKFNGVVVVDCQDMRSADVLLCVWMLGGHLQNKENMHVTKSMVHI